MGGIGAHSAQRIGLLGGTFDPPHIGHLWLGETAREQLKLDKVLFLPVGQPPHKDGQPVTAVAHRLRMTELMLNGTPGFELDTSDIDRPPPHRTYTLLPLLAQKYPGASFWFLIGSDSLRDLDTWQEPGVILNYCRLAVLPRPGVVIDWPRLQTAVPGLVTAVDMLDGPVLAITSTAIREWAGRGYSCRYLIHSAVANYIQRHHLY